MLPALRWYNLQHGRMKFSSRLWIWDFLPELVFSWVGIVSFSFQRLVPLSFHRRLWFCERNVSSVQVPEIPVKMQRPGHGALPSSGSHSTHLMTRKRYFRKMGSIGLLRWLSRRRHLLWKPRHPGSDPQSHNIPYKVEVCLPLPLCGTLARSITQHMCVFMYIHANFVSIITKGVTVRHHGISSFPRVGQATAYIKNTFFCIINHCTSSVPISLNVMRLIFRICFQQALQGPAWAVPPPHKLYTLLFCWFPWPVLYWGSTG